jgi:hypothetical protein
MGATELRIIGRWAFSAVLLIFATTNSADVIAAQSMVVGSVDCSGSLCELRDAKIDGEITTSTVAEIHRLIAQTEESAARHKTLASFIWGIELDSPGGSVTAAMEIGRLFREKHVWVIVPHWARCASACVLLLAGAVNRVIAGKVGIHRPYLEVPKQEATAERVKSLYAATLSELRSYFREMNVSEQLADAMLRIEPEHIKFLDDRALANYGLTETDPVEQEMSDLQEAQYFGLDRSQYIERKQLAAKLCPSTLTPCYQQIMKTGHAPTITPASPDFSQYGRPGRN